MGFIIFFVIVLILVLAFKSSKKEETVTKTDIDTGRTIVETHVLNSPSAGQTAARIVLGIIGVLIILVVLVFFGSLY